MSVVETLVDEITSNPPSINGPIHQLVQGFTKYLKEPRYSSPLTIKELSHLFGNFYNDLNSTVLTIYTQSNSTKKSLISKTNFFKENPDQFDYLLAIANYSSSSIKLVKRVDTAALIQLRIFNLYKFLIVWDIIERAQILLFDTVSNRDDDISLYDKLFKFDEKDIVGQEFFDKKLDALKKLQLPFDAFIEENDTPKPVVEFLNSEVFDDVVGPALDKFTLVNHTTTPLSKLKIITELQKAIISVLSDHCDMKPHAINNDVLLPVLIYLIIYKVKPQLDLVLNFNFIKNFVNFVDPYDVSILSNTSFYFYNPSDAKASQKPISRKTTIFDCLNLNETSTPAASTETQPSSSDPEFEFEFFATDKELVQYLNSNYLNTSELQYYLTNFEAVLFFIQNVTIDELSKSHTSEEEILLNPLNVLMDREFAAKFEFPKIPQTTSEQEPADNRSRSSSLFNNLTNKITEATNKNRSRSNSNLLKNTREAFPTIDTTDLNSSVNSPLHSPSGSGDMPFDSSTSFGMMRNILGRFSSVNVSQLRAPEEEEGLIPKHVRSSSLIDRLSPNNSRTRASSLENGMAASPTRKNTIASKLSSGVTDLMTKINTPAGTQGEVPSTATTTETGPAADTEPTAETGPVNALGHTVNASQTSLKSLEEAPTQSSQKPHPLPPIPSASQSQPAPDSKRPDNLRTRTASMQIMEKWFNNISFSNQQTNEAKPDGHLNNDSISESREGSVFSTPSKELARYHNVDFDSLTVSDLRTLKVYYDQLCNELGVGKYESKSTADELNDQISSLNSI